MSKDIKALEILLSISNKIPFFKGLITDVNLFSYKNKQLTFREGDSKDDSMYYLLSGSLAVSKINEKTNIKVRLATIDEPTLFGEMMHLTGESRNATIEANTDNTLAIAFRTKNIEEQEVTHISQFYKNVIIEMSKKIDQMNKKLSQ